MDATASARLPKIAGRVEDRERGEAHFLDGVLDYLHLRGILHPHAERGINRLVARGTRNFAQVGGLHHRYEHLAA